ncbi:MAG: DUF4375 domain-containing protein [Clostridia bacterium]|nr:DUF4375 domain-containing protein [Clostridia bacterium]
MKKKEALYMSMTHKELSSLSDDCFFEAIMYRTEHWVGLYEQWEEGVNSLNPYQKIFYSVNWLAAEVNNGGLCQFFVNSSRMVAPYVSEYMSAIGAMEHKKLFDKFVSDNNIDLNNLSSFDVDSFEEFNEQSERYPFDEYDDAFFNLTPLEEYLTQFAKEHLEHF